MVTKEKTRAEILKNLRKTFGNDAVFSGNDKIVTNIDPVPTGSYLLNDIIGIEGVPRGRITQYGGATRSGKTFMSLQAVKSWQLMSPDNFAIWIDAEFSFEPSWATKLGVDMDRLQVVRENDGAKIFNGLCGIPHPKTGKVLGGTLNELIEVGGRDSGCGLIVLDSIASIIPPVESGYEIGHQNMAALARFLPAALRRLVPLLEKSNIAMIFINQIRVDPGVQYGNPESSPGGNALKHTEHLMVNFAKLTATDKRIENSKGEPIGHTIRVRIDKNRVGLPGREAEVRIKYLEGVVDINQEILTLGVGYKLIARPNNRTYIYKDNKWGSKADALEGLLDKKIQSEILEDIRKAKSSGQSFDDVADEPEENDE